MKSELALVEGRVKCVWRFDNCC